MYYKPNLIALRKFDKMDIDIIIKNIKYITQNIPSLYFNIMYDSMFV